MHAPLLLVTELVDALSSTWGVTPHDEDGMTVWFEVARPF
jgi:hypothetical protein